MPYIKSEDRIHLENLAKLENSGISDIGRNCRTAGELNYTITKIIHAYFYTRGGRYQQINDIVGALESCKAEFQRRIVNPYEDLKIKESGDVE